MKKDEIQRLANSAYKERRRARLFGEVPHDPFMNGIIVLVLNQAKVGLFKENVCFKKTIISIDNYHMLW